MLPEVCKDAEARPSSAETALLSRRIVHHPEMTWIPGRTFTMGSDAHEPEEAPAHPVKVSGFWMDKTAVTNADFARFVARTGYVTLAERPLDRAQYPGVLAEMLVPGGGADA